MLKSKLILFLVFFVATFYGCEIKEPTAPTWNIDLNLPLTNKSYNILDVLKRSNNVGFDSLNNGLVFLYGESNYKRIIGEDVRFDGILTSNIQAPSNLPLDTSLIIDDSTFIRKADFISGILNFTFFNRTNENYTFNGTIKNLFKISNNETAKISGNVSSGQMKSINLIMGEYYVKNDVPNNSLKLNLNFQSNNPILISFDYSLSAYSIKTIQGLLKPMNTGIFSHEVVDPFGSDVPEGELHFSYITPNKNFLVVKKYASLYQVDLTQISMIGENKNGRKVRLKYLRNGNTGDPIDSIFNLKLPSDKDSVAYPLNESNSNILEFINNIPKKIVSTRNDFLNLPYTEGQVTFTDSLILKFQIQVPLDVSITQPIIFNDTVNVGVAEGQRNALDDAQKLVFNFNAINGFPLRATAKILILDTFFTPLIAISKILANQADSSVLINAASVGIDGFVNNINTTTYTAELDSSQIRRIKNMGKIIYEYRLYTDQNLIPSPLATVKIKRDDIIKTLSFGTLKYRVSFE